MVHRLRQIVLVDCMNTIRRPKCTRTFSARHAGFETGLERSEQWILWWESFAENKGNIRIHLLKVQTHRKKTKLFG